ncbi:MAG: glutaredoxin family protein [candidate division Zixibacteria bacterium]|nr:glutaredoxin family protein [candidate division Zixibacteria bacterium]
MKMMHVNGKNKGHIVLYTLSTCGWCKKTKRLLNEMEVEYYYNDVDLLEGKSKEKTLEEISRWNPACTFPTLVIDNKCIVGYQEKEIKGKLGL